MWDNVVESYRRFAEFNRWYYRLFALFISQYATPKTAVDICCGPGILSSELKRVFPEAEIVSLDLSKEMCKISKAIRADAHSLPFKKEIFDVAILCFALHELEIRKAIEEVKRVLKREGILAIADLNSRVPSIFKAFALAYLAFLISPEYSKSLAITWNKFPDRESLIIILEDCGFKVVYSREFFDIWIIAKKI